MIQRGKTQVRAKLIFQSSTVAPLGDSNGVNKRMWTMLVRNSVALGHSWLLPSMFPILVFVLVQHGKNGGSKVEGSLLGWPLSINGSLRTNTFRILSIDGGLRFWDIFRSISLSIRVCHSYGKTHGFRVMVFVGMGTVPDLANPCLLRHPWHSVMGTLWVIYNPHGLQQATSFLLLSSFLLDQLSSWHSHLHWQLHIYFLFFKLPALFHHADTTIF